MPALKSKALIKVMDHSRTVISVQMVNMHALLSRGKKWLVFFFYKYLQSELSNGKCCFVQIII